MSFPGGSDSRICSQCGRPRFDPWIRKISWRRNDYPLHYSCLENSVDREPGGLHSTGSERVRHDWTSNSFTFKLRINSLVGIHTRMTNNWVPNRHPGSASQACHLSTASGTALRRVLAWLNTLLLPAWNYLSRLNKGPDIFSLHWTVICSWSFMCQILYGALAPG